MLSRKTILFALSTLFIAASTLRAELPTRVNFGEQTLQLNGEGKRTKTFITVYESGLYLTQPSKNGAQVVSADEPMAIRIKITSGFVSRSSLIQSLYDSLKTSTGGRMDTIKAETQMLLKGLSDEVAKGDVYDFVHVPNSGLQVYKNSSLKTTIPGITFKKAMFGIWLSSAPVDQSLRQAMLAGRNFR